jgi:hypothetical protein
MFIRIRRNRSLTELIGLEFRLKLFCRALDVIESGRSLSGTGK